MARKYRMVRMTNVVKPPFQFFDEVCSKKTGFPGKGKIFGVIHPLAFETFLVRKKMSYWDYVFGEGWRELPVYYVIYEQLRKVMTLDEVAWAEPNATTEQHKHWFESQPMAQAIFYPAMDLEMFEPGILSKNSDKVQELLDES